MSEDRERPTRTEVEHMNFGAIGRRALEERHDLVAPWYHRAARLVRRAPHQPYSHDARGPEDDARGRGGHGRGAIVTRRTGRSLRDMWRLEIA